MLATHAQGFRAADRFWIVDDARDFRNRGPFDRRPGYQDKMLFKDGGP
jgi:hypothetical protein